MGGGGVMRAAAKVAGFGVIGGSGLRGVPNIPSAEGIVSTVSRKASRPVASIVTSHDGVVSGDVGAPMQRPSWEIDEWEFAGFEDQLTLNSADPLPRVVFGGVPTMDEAKEATSELKDALENLYLKPSNNTGSEGSFIVGQEPNLPIVLSNSESSEITSQTATAPSVSKNAMQAFKFLCETPAAQSVVASIACDPNVWEAVMKNELLTEYMQSNNIVASSPGMDLNVNKSTADGDFQEQISSKDTEHPDGASESGNFGSGFNDFLENIKLTVADMLSNFSGFIQNIFGGSGAEKKSMDADGSGQATFMDPAVLGPRVVGLASLVIMVVVFKRVYL